MSEGNDAAVGGCSVFHLISSHEIVLRWRLTPKYVALCGALVETSDGRTPACPNECECVVVHCPACLHAAMECNREAGSSAPALEFGMRVPDR